MWIDRRGCWPAGRDGGAGNSPGSNRPLDSAQSLLHTRRSRGGIVVHKIIADRGLEKNVIISNAIINMYGKCGQIDQARAFLDRMYFRDTVSWNAIVSAYAQNGHQSDAVKMLFVMQLEGVKIGKIGFVTLLKTCCDPMFLQTGRLIHSCLAEDGLHETDVTTGTSLVHIADESRRVFQSMDCPDAVAWSSIIAVLAEQGNGKGLEAMVFLWRMQLESVRPNNVTLVAALNAVGACLMHFAKISHKDATSWKALITIYAQNQHGKIALDSLKHMQLEGFRMNKHTSVNAIIACTEIYSLNDGKRVHGWIRERGRELDVLLGNAVVNLYSKCGSLDAAYAMFFQLRREDVITWSAMVGAYARHGHAPRRALGRSLQLCVDEERLWDPPRCEVLRVHGRSSRAIEEMVRFVVCSPVEGDAVVWRAVLAACRSLGKVEIGNRAVKRTRDLENKRKREDKRSNPDIPGMRTSEFQRT
ncbi:pentatricopeptide repeat-containing protein At2g27610-like [Selaginella moellendorffii]|uniref:pentatricopeptide repeat-containing protein At2g27610-like n=1 Tax=Selaginella moellendorffii TaxID=88036 RepID=UPI000D1CBD04|nr:pentatricopeptide repeat-containing protein At2g27610-like [Selaginella moellendorffii]|eukprot:XP_024534800.1 pentatricopeptide repeat-containing protein At2g27610-like [Selaginella moellendorffii]